MKIFYILLLLPILPLQAAYHFQEDQTVPEQAPIIQQGEWTYDELEAELLGTPQPPKKAPAKKLFYYNCPCGSTIEDREFEQHIKKEHKAPHSQYQYSEYTCPASICSGRGLLSLRFFKSHIKEYHMQQSNNRQEISNSFEVLDQPTTCPCGTFCATKADLRDHLKEKHKQRVYICPADNCDKQYSGIVAIEDHIKAKHIDQANYKCKICGYAATYMGSITKHVANCINKRNNNILQNYQIDSENNSYFANGIDSTAN